MFWRCVHHPAHRRAAGVCIVLTSAAQYVICDTRLEFPELIRVDQPIEVLFTGEEGMAAFPLSGCAPSGALGGGHLEERACERFVVTWERGDDGWMVLPPYRTYRAEEGEHLSSGWYGDLRYSVHQDVRAKVKWTQFSSGYFRCVPCTPLV